jgi:hypothetical protein
VKLVYCGDCDTVSSLATLEPERCQQCGKPAVRIEVPRPWQYWGTIVIFLVALAVLLALNIPEIQFRFLVFLPFLGVGLVLSTWGMRVSKGRALEAGRALAKGKKT